VNRAWLYALMADREIAPSGSIWSPLPVAHSCTRAVPACHRGPAISGRGLRARAILIASLTNWRARSSHRHDLSTYRWIKETSKIPILIDLISI
jgi:hypothetical protein